MEVAVPTSPAHVLVARAGKQHGGACEVGGAPGGLGAQAGGEGHEQGWMGALRVGALGGDDGVVGGWDVGAAQALVGWVERAIDAPVALLPT